MALTISNLAYTLTNSMVSLTDALNTSAFDLVNSLHSTAMQLGSVAMLPSYRMSAGAERFGRNAALLLRLRRARSASIELTPLRIALIMLVLDLLLRYPVTKVWDYIWGKLFP
jgi:hypothetical protein